MSNTLKKEMKNHAIFYFSSKGSRKIFFLVARPLRGEGGKGRATKKKEPFVEARKKCRKKCGHSTELEGGG